MIPALSAHPTWLLVALAVGLLVIAIGQFMDGWTTYKILRAEGWEKNEIIAWTITKFGLVPALLFWKAWSMGAALIAAWYALHGFPEVGLFSLAVIAALTWNIVLKNLNVKKESGA